MKRLWNWIKQLFTKRPRERSIAARRAFIPPSLSVLTRREAANYVGFPFQQPNGKLPPDFFWKQDEGAIGFAHWLDGAKPRAWRIYRKPVERVER